MMRSKPLKSPFILGFDGITLDNSLARHLSTINPAGVILFRRNIESEKQVKKLVVDLRDLLGNIVISIDHEGGIVNRFPPGFPLPPSPRALNYASDEGLLRKACQYQAELLSCLGFNLNFAPVLDLDLDPDNRVIGTRAFSGKPVEVGEYAKACIREHDLLGVGTTAKHFPTHGRTATDSHTATGCVYHESRLMLEDDLYPFKEAIAAGVPAMMTAHLTYSVLDDELPATLSSNILDRLLRRDLGFNGLVISDCVEMEGISRHFKPETILQKGLTAGVDLMISSFSMKKDREFQQRLYGAYREINQSGRGDEKKREKRLNGFLDRYPALLRKVKQMPDENDVIELHTRTLEKRTTKRLPGGYQNLFLVELVNRPGEGINADTGFSLLTQIIADHCDKVAKTRVVQQGDENGLEEIINTCNDERLTCVLLTRDDFKSHGYHHFVKLLKNADSSLHIALMDQRDLVGESPIEWATRGCNATTGRMLADQLKKLK